jgi:flagellar basal-body rod protein FlgC
MEIDGNMFGAIDIAVSGLKAYGKQMEVVSSNIANARTTDAGDGQPYRRLEAIFKATEDGASGVEISELVKDMSDFQKILASPGDPRADADGYISMPNVQLPVELINLNLASRAYQANAAILKRYQKMVESSLELLK